MLHLLSLALGIIGGSPSSDEAVVCLSADTLPLCSGVLISGRTVLTAGHCIEALGPGVPYFVNSGPTAPGPSPGSRWKSNARIPRTRERGSRSISG